MAKELGSLITTTIPAMDEIQEIASLTPLYMRQTILPIALYYEGFLTHVQCDEILKQFMVEEPYSFEGCHATTREIGRVPNNRWLDSVKGYAQAANEQFWKFHLDPLAASWLQTYVEGDHYQLHADMEIGQSRKLTAILLLSDPDQYDGGILQLVHHPHVIDIPKTRGTVVVFPAWEYHRVTEVTSGLRQTINMGFWGPPFR